MNDMYDYFSEAVAKHPELYKGLENALSSQQFIDGMDELKTQFKNEYHEDPSLADDDYTEDEFVEYMINDFSSRVILDVWGNQFIKNLFDAGFVYNSDDESWTLPDESYMDPIFKDMNVTNYGLIWLLWYDLDTSPRESLSDYFNEIVNDYFYSID